MEFSQQNIKKTFSTTPRPNTIYLVLLDSVMIPNISKMCNFVTCWLNINCKFISTQFPRREIVPFDSLVAIRMVSDAILNKENGYCALGLTLSELHNRDNQNIYGTHCENSGVVSLNPSNFTNNYSLDAVLSVVAREIGYLFNLKQCNVPKCVMNVRDRNLELPFFLCSCDTNKLKRALSVYNTTVRQANLESCYSKHNGTSLLSKTSLIVPENSVKSFNRPMPHILQYLSP